MAGNGVDEFGFVYGVFPSLTQAALGTAINRQAPRFAGSDMDFIIILLRFAVNAPIMLLCNIPMRNTHENCQCQWFKKQPQ
jgi:hypothetical protein